MQGKDSKMHLCTQSFICSLTGDGLVTKQCPTVVTLWTVAHQALLSMGFPGQEYWSGLPFPTPGDLPNPGIKLMSPELPALADRFFTIAPHGKSTLSDIFTQFYPRFVQDIQKGTLIWSLAPINKCHKSFKQICLQHTIRKSYQSHIYFSQVI